MAILRLGVQPQSEDWVVYGWQLSVSHPKLRQKIKDETLEDAVLFILDDVQLFLGKEGSRSYGGLRKWRPEVDD